MRLPVTARVTGPDVIRLRLALASSGATEQVTPPLAVNEFGFVRHVFDGLAADTAYRVSVETPSGLQGALVGEARTPPAGPHSFGFASASCSTTGSNALIYDGIRARAEAGDIEFFVHTGDLHYEDIAINDEALFHNAYDQVFAATRQRALWSVLPMNYMWDDHDFGPNNTDRDNPARQAAIAAYRSRVPSPVLALSGPEDAPYYSFVRGRVRFVVTDIRSERTGQGEFPTDSPDSYVFTDAQRDWFFAELLAARDADQGVIWVNTKPWVAITANGRDDWGGYNRSRQEIADFIDAESLTRRMCILSGDMHAVAYDDGSSENNPAGLRVMQAAALDRSASQKGGPYLLGPFPPSGSSTVSQYGVIDVTDTGSGDIGIRFRGIQVDRSTGDETEAIDVSFDLGPPE